MELVIQNSHFTKCSNNNCNTIFAVKLNEVAQLNQLFCPKCNNALNNSHLVQCKNCQAVVNFIPLFPNEEASVFYVPKCRLCSGTIKDEQHLSTQYFPKSFI